MASDLGLEVNIKYRKWYSLRLVERTDPWIEILSNYSRLD